MGAAAPRAAARADRENNQHLGGQALHEPSGLKKRLIGTEEVEQDVKGQGIEQRTDRPEYQHEALNQPQVPLRWPPTHRIAGC